MSKPITIPNLFAAAVGPIPLSQLDADLAVGAAAINDLATYGSYFVDSSGAPNVITITTSPGLTFSYSTGIPLQLKVSNTNTLSAVTINVNGLGAIPLLNSDASVLGVSQLLAGMIIFVMFDGTNFRLISGNQGSFPGFVTLNSGAQVANDGLFVTGSLTGAYPATGQGLSITGGATVNVTALNQTGPAFLPLNLNATKISGLGPIAGVAVDMTPDRGTFILTHTGFTAGVTSTATWYRIGNVVFLNTGSVGGTSNATTWTATGLPAAIQPTLSVQTVVIGDVKDAGASVPGSVSLSSGSGTLTFGAGFNSGAAFTNSGAKGFFNTGGTTFAYLLG